MRLPLHWTRWIPLRPECAVAVRLRVKSTERPCDCRGFLPETQLYHAAGVCDCWCMEDEEVLDIVRDANNIEDENVMVFDASNYRYVPVGWLAGDNKEERP